MSVSRLPPARRKCATCPFREGSPYQYLAEYLAESAENISRICHSTGSDSAIYGDTHKPERPCRGTRDLQLGRFFALGFIKAATDAAWDAKCREMNL